MQKKGTYHIGKAVILLCFIGLKFAIQYTLIGPEYELHRDEFLHLDQADHLAWGYLSVPPVTSVISCIIKMLGNSVFWIKFFPALFGALTIMLVWKTIEELKGNLFALLFGTSCITFSVLFRLNTLYQPNSLDVLCWTTFYYIVIKYLNRRQSKWIYLLAVVFALGFLNKYNMVFLLCGIVPAIWLTKERKIFSDRNLYYGAGLSLILILPNLVWQVINHFPVIHHLKELADTQLVHVHRWDFVRTQFLFFPGTFLVILFGLYALLKFGPFARYRLFLWSFLLTMAIFVVLKAKSYYTLGMYPVYFAFGSVYISSLLENRAGRIIKPILVAGSVACFIPMYTIAFPHKSPQYIENHPEKYRQFGMLTWEDGKEHQLPQDFADMLGWKELAHKVDSAYLIMPNPKTTLILCDNYGQAGAINYYSKLGIKAVTFNADYINWFDLDTPYNNLIRVRNSWEEEEELKSTSPYFRKSFKAGSITNPYAREYGTAILCFIDAHININERIREEIIRKKQLP